MWPWLSAADPGRVHTEGRMARVALEDAREQVAALFGTRPRQVIFTSGATEAINAAVYGALHVRATSCRATAGSWPWPPSSTAPSARPPSGTAGRRWHRDCWPWTGPDGSILDSVQTPARGAPPWPWSTASGRTTRSAPSSPSPRWCRRAASTGVLVHVDAAAAAGHVPMAFDDLGADLMSCPPTSWADRGVWAPCWSARGLRVPPLLVGGAQERARRAGLENVAAAVGFGAAAAELASRPASGRRSATAAAAFTDRLRAVALGVPASRPTVRLERPTGSRTCVCLGIGGVEAEAVLIGLDQAGVAAHSGSACSSELLEPSPVLAAMGVDAERSLRLSVGWSTTDAEVAMAERALPEVIGRLRGLAGAGG